MVRFFSLDLRLISTEMVQWTQSENFLVSSKQQKVDVHTNANDAFLLILLRLSLNCEERLSKRPPKGNRWSQRSVETTKPKSFKINKSSYFTYKCIQFHKRILFERKKVTRIRKWKLCGACNNQGALYIISQLCTLKKIKNEISVKRSAQCGRIKAK